MRASDEDLYLKHGADLVRFATALVGPWDAEDVVSAAVLSCFSSARWVRVDQPRAYLYRAVLNQARRRGRVALRRAAREAAWSHPNSAESAFLRVEIVDAMKRLSFRQRAVLVLVYWQDLTPEDVAARLGLSKRTVYRELKAAHARLKEAFNEEV